MRILIVTAYSLHLNTSGILQNLIIIDGLKRLGHNIDVLTTEISTTHEAYDDSLSLKDIDNYYELKMPTIYSSLRTKKKQNKIVSYIKKIIKNIYNEVQVIDGYAVAANNLDALNITASKYDCVLSFSDPKSSHVIAQRFIEKYHLEALPWIQYWGDPLYYDISRKKKKFLEGLVKRTEYNLIKDATKVVYATPFTSSQQKRMFKVFADKIDYATQGYWKDYSVLEKANNETFTVGYFGSYSPNTRNIMPLYDAVTEMKDVCMKIGGSGLPLKSNNNVKIMGRLRHEDVRNAEQSCDLLICLLNSCGTQIPGKLYYYASINKPLLVIVDGENGQEMKEFLSHYNRYEFCNNDTQSIKNAIQEIKNNPFDLGDSLSEKFEPEYIAKRILSGVFDE